MISPADRTAIIALVEAFRDGWNSSNGIACAQPFREDADFTAVNGIRVKGREEIGRGHDEILATIFRGTTLDYTVNSIDLLRPDVASADLTLRLTPASEPSWIPKSTSCGVIATKDHGQWSIAVFRNMVRFERPLAGQLDREYFERSVAAEQRSPA